MTASADWGSGFAKASVGMTGIYDDILVPRLFDPWATVLLDLVELRRGETVVDVATGPGTVARAAARRAGPSGRVVGCDFSAAMLAVARSKPPAIDAAAVEYVECPADALDVPSGLADVVTCQHGLQFFPDRPAALAEMRRVLRGGGRLAVAVWRDISECRPFAALAQGVADVLGDEAAALYRGGPWGLSHRDELAKLFKGWHDVTISRYELPLVFDGGARQLVDTLVTTAVAPQVGALDDTRRQALVDAVARAAAPITDGGAISASAASNVIRARA